MTRLKWGAAGQKFFETGVSRGVLYLSNNGIYDEGYAWVGLTSVTESPSGGESNKQYADNQVYLNLKSAEEFGCTIESFAYPWQFEQCDGTVIVAGGIGVGQQSRRSFGFSYQTKVGNDLNPDLGYKIHLVYGADAAPSEKARNTVNDTPELSAFSWEVTTTAVEVGVVDGTELKPTAHITVDSTKYSTTQMTALEDILYGTAGADPRMPLPSELFALFSGAVTEVETQSPTYDATTDTVTVPVVPGVIYEVNGEPVSGSFVITEDTVVTARPSNGYTFTETSDTDWTINYS